MKIRITRTVKLHQNILKKVVAELLLINGSMTFIEERVPIMFEEDDFEWNNFFNICAKYRESNQFDENDFLVVLTELRNDANWFSAFSQTGERTVFIHASDWENYIYSEPEFPIAYEVVTNVMQSLSYKELNKDFYKYVHVEPIGCINDMCGWKPDITFKLRTGDICPECLTLFSSIIQKDIIEQSVTIFESTRKRMLFNKAWQKPM